MEYKITVREILEHSLTIEADSINEAIDKAKKLYRNEEIVLDSNDHVDTEFVITGSNSSSI